MWALYPVVRNWHRNRDAELLPLRDDPTGSDPRPALLDREGYRPESWVCHPLNVAYVGKPCRVDLLERCGAKFKKICVRPQSFQGREYLPAPSRI